MTSDSSMFFNGPIQARAKGYSETKVQVKALHKDQFTPEDLSDDEMAVSPEVALRGDAIQDQTGQTETIVKAEGEQSSGEEEQKQRSRSLEKQRRPRKIRTESDRMI